jgi:hypothetical protein
MANSRQLSILWHGIDGWNRWRRYDHEDYVDISGAILTKANLTDGDLRDVNFKRAKLSGATLIRAD